MNLFLSGGKAFSGDVPVAYRKYLLPGATPFYAEFSGGAVLLQQMGVNGFYMRYDRSFAQDVIEVAFSTLFASLSLLYVLEGSFSVDNMAQFKEGECYLCCIGISPGHSVRFGKGLSTQECCWSRSPQRS